MAKDSPKKNHTQANATMPNTPSATNAACQKTALRRGPASGAVSANRPRPVSPRDRTLAPSTRRIQVANRCARAHHQRRHRRALQATANHQRSERGHPGAGERGQGHRMHSQPAVLAGDRSGPTAGRGISCAAPNASVSPVSVSARLWFRRNRRQCKAGRGQSRSADCQ